MRSRDDILRYTRTSTDEEILIALNIVHQPRKLDWTGQGLLLLSTYLDAEAAIVQGPILLRPDEGIMLKVQG